jgi:TatD DNase family protein
VLRDWLANEKPVAVGEIGLDLHVAGLDPARQEFFFVEQLKLACAFDLPVILHVRRAVDQILKHLRRQRVPGGIAHAFNGSRQQADEFIRLGFRLGFGGAMTFSGSTRIRQLAATLPAESIVLETDAPDIPPAWLDRGRNSPAELPRVAGVLAELRKISPEDLAALTTANARSALRGL